MMGNLSHHSINRFLERERYELKGLFDNESRKIEKVGGILSLTGFSFSLLMGSFNAQRTYRTSELSNDRKCVSQHGF